MPNRQLAHCMRPATADDYARRGERNRVWTQQEQAESCPTCHEIETGEATANADGCLVFEDQHSFAVLESYPRGLGHTIVLAKGHVADITELPEQLGCHLMRVMVRLAGALKEVTGCAKVYQVTMCSGTLSHLHFQLLPRLPGEQIGGRVFSTARMVLARPQPLAAAVKRALARRSGEGSR